MKNILVILSLILLSVVTSCSSHKLENNTQQKDNTENEVIITLRENTLEQFDSIQLINSAEKYYQITNTINSIRRPGIEFKEIDFKSNSVLLINMKTDNYTDFTIYSKTNPENTTIYYSGIYYEKNTTPLKHIRLIKLIQLPKTQEIKAFQPMH